MELLQWFVKEQTEEETMALNLLDKIKIAGAEKASGDALYALDRDLENSRTTLHWQKQNGRKPMINFKKAVCCYQNSRNYQPL